MKAKSAKGAKGTLIEIFGDIYFRVYSKEHEEGFIDYQLAHSDLEVTISSDCDATFYTFDDERIEPRLDHSPDTMGYEIKEQK